MNTLKIVTCSECDNPPGGIAKLQGLVGLRWTDDPKTEIDPRWVQKFFCEKHMWQQIDFFEDNDIYRYEFVEQDLEDWA